jgi:hypothetical protein
VPALLALRRTSSDVWVRLSHVDGFEWAAQGATMSSIRARA